VAPKKRKIRVAFKKNRGKKPRAGHELREAIRQDDVDQLAASERVSGKGQLTRYRTVIATEAEPVAGSEQNFVLDLEVDRDRCLSGRVLFIVGAHQCRVQVEDGTVYVCAVRQVLRTLSQNSRNAVVAGDRVLFEPRDGLQGMILHVEPRSGILGRGVGRSQQLLVTNVDLAVIIIGAVDPHFKPNLIDRFLVSCEKGGVVPVICINKCDLADMRTLLPVAGLYAGLGYQTVLTSAATGFGIKQLARIIRGRQTVFSGQSGVGKSTLLNAIQPKLGLITSHVSKDSGKGRHTTRTAILKRLDQGGWVVDTPGIRQLRLWDVRPEEVEGFFIEFRPFVRYCKFPNCMHVHEQQCGIKDAGADELISQQRYASYLKIISDDPEDD